MIKRFFEGKTLGQVAPFLVEKFKQERTLTPVAGKHPRERAAATVNREVEILSKAFSLAEDNGLVGSHPCRRVRKLRLDNLRTRYLTADEEKRLVTSLTGRRAYLRPIVVLALNTGMRRGEITRFGVEERRPETWSRLCHQHKKWRGNQACRDPGAQYHSDVGSLYSCDR